MREPHLRQTLSLLSQELYMLWSQACTSQFLKAYAYSFDMHIVYTWSMVYLKISFLCPNIEGIIQYRNELWYYQECLSC